MTAITEDTLRENFAQSAFFRKTSVLKAADIRLSEGNEHIVTIVDGRTEREGITKPGDHVVTGQKGEQYIVTKEKFPTLYEPDPNDAGIFRSKNAGWALTLEDDATIVRNDGTEVSGKKGDALLFSFVSATVNVIDAQVFAKSYKPEPAGQAAFLPTWNKRPPAL